MQGENAFHLSETFGFGDALMSPDLDPGEVIRKLTPVEAAMFEDMGWNVSPLAIIPEPSTLMLLAIGFTCLAALRCLAEKSTSQLKSVQFNASEHDAAAGAKEAPAGARTIAEQVCRTHIRQAMSQKRFNTAVWIGVQSVRVMPALAELEYGLGAED